MADVKRSAGVLVGALVVAGIVWRLVAGAGAPAARNSVVLITVDTLRRDHVGRYGYPRPTTPHLDRFFERGTTFSNATSPSPCTVPAVLQLLTGLRSFDPRAQRLAEILRHHGYRTAAIVSQHHFRTGAGPLPSYARGFDHFDIQPAGHTDHHGMTARTASEISDRAIAWLDGHPRQQPFFLWLHYFDPHDPYEAPEEHRVFPLPAPCLDGDRRAHLYAAMDAALRRADPETRRTILERPNPHAHFGSIYSDEQVRTLRSHYDAEILYTDAQIGRVLGRLGEAGLLERSLVIVTSDHGERLGEGGRWAHCQSLHGYEINVPLLLLRPGQPRGERVARAVSTLDIVPTVLAALGIAHEPSALDGVDLLAEGDERLVYAVWEREHAIQDDTWKLKLGTRGGVAGTGLYDLAEDPEEGVDVAAAHPEEVARLERVLRENAAADGKLLSKIEETLEQLRAIGYVR